MDGPLEDWIEVGRVTGFFGIRGWLKIHSFTEPRANIFDYDPWYLQSPDAFQDLPAACHVVSGKNQGRGLIVKLAGCDDRNSAEKWLQARILVVKTQLPQLEKGEFYWYQLEGLKVINQSDACFGTVDHLIRTGANDVLVIHPDEASIDARERLIPLVFEDIVMEVDLTQRFIKVAWETDY